MSNKIELDMTRVAIVNHSPVLVNGGDQTEVYWYCPECNSVNYDYEIYDILLETEAPDFIELIVECEKCKTEYDLDITGRLEYILYKMEITKRRQQNEIHKQNKST